MPLYGRRPRKPVFYHFFWDTIAKTRFYDSSQFKKFYEILRTIKTPQLQIIDILNSAS
jgi:hypothetical protein